MDKFTRISEFTACLFSDEQAAEQASEIIRGILAARSPRISDIASRMRGGEAACYKRVQRFLHRQDPREALKLLFNEEAEFVLGDPTEIERPHAHKTAYVGTLKDGQTKGFWMLTLATPVRGRAIPFHFLTYSSRTFEEQPSSRNLEHFKAIQEIKALIGSRPIIFDREFSYLRLLESLVASDVRFVIRLNMGSNPPNFYYDAERKLPLRLAIAPISKPRFYRQVYYMGEVPVNIAGIWQYGFKQPIWIITNLEPEEGLALYAKRMKIEVCFRDLKSLLHIDKVMHKSQTLLEKMMAMVMLAYAISIVIGEAIRDVQYGRLSPQDFNLLQIPETDKCSRWHLFSGPFLFIKQRYHLPDAVLNQIVQAALLVFSNLVFASNVRSFVPT
jgi:hypothetical protein